MIAIRNSAASSDAERWVRSIKEECLSKLILFGEKSLRRVVSNFLEHYHPERNNQGKGNLLLFPSLCLRQVREAQSVVESGSAAYSNSTAAAHEYFGQTRQSNKKPPMRNCK